MKNFFNKLGNILLTILKTVSINWVLFGTFIIMAMIYFSGDKIGTELNLLLWFGTLAVWLAFSLLAHLLVGEKTIGISVYYKYNYYTEKGTSVGDGLKFKCLTISKTCNTNQKLFELQKNIIEEIQKELKEENQDNLLITKIDYIK